MEHPYVDTLGSSPLDHLVRMTLEHDNERLHTVAGKLLGQCQRGYLGSVRGQVSEDKTTPEQRHQLSGFGCHVGHTRSTMRSTRAIREFLATEAAGGIALMAATAIALMLANSPLHDGYERLLGSEVAGLSTHTLVEKGLMSIFFFVVGLEIKREVVDGELRSMRTALLPVCCAVGGAVVPALIYLAITSGTAAQSGWGIPMATDIAFAVGVMALLGTRAPTSLKVFVLALAVADDLIAIAVIAVFYSSGVSLIALVAAASGMAGIVVLRRFHVHHPLPFVAIGIGVYSATAVSGVSPTIAAVGLAFAIPARSHIAGEDPKPEDAADIDPPAMAERLEHLLHPYVAFLVMPLFALANAGVRISADALATPEAQRAALGIVVGLVVGKLVGIVGTAALLVGLQRADLPDDTSWTQFVGASALAGIGFTVSLFVASLSFPGGGSLDASLGTAARLGILAGSAIAAVVGSAVLLVTGRGALRRPRRADAVPGQHRFG